MRTLVDGEPVDLCPHVEGVSVSRLGDRLLIRTPDGTHSAAVVRLGERTLVSYLGHTFEIEKLGASRKGSHSASEGEAHAPMPGQIVEVFVTLGDSVALGQKLLVLEAMKTQQPVVAPFDGVVESLPVKKGEQVAEGALLVKIAAHLE